MSKLECVSEDAEEVSCHSPIEPVARYVCLTYVSRKKRRKT